MAAMAKWRRHTVEFKRQAVERMKTCENIYALARELRLERKLLYGTHPAATVPYFTPPKEAPQGVLKA